MISQLRFKRRRGHERFFSPRSQKQGIGTIDAMSRRKNDKATDVSASLHVPCIKPKVNVPRLRMRTRSERALRIRVCECDASMRSRARDGIGERLNLQYNTNSTIIW